MDIFQLYLGLGFEHIADPRGYDHILFVATLCGIYLFPQWKKVLILITAFTIGHSITLALATLKFVHISSDLIEFLIPVTIFITALANILQKQTRFSKRLHLFKYLTAMLFGLIHGLGFSNFLRSLLGMEQSIVKPLLAFNIGLEIGQLAIVAAIMLLAFVFVKILKAPHREWNLVLSGAGLGISLIMSIERLAVLFEL